MFTTLKRLFTKKDTTKVQSQSPQPPRSSKNVASGGAEPAPKRSRNSRNPKVAEQSPLTPKELATQRGEPWVEVLQFEMDSQDIHTGNFTLDYNDKFVLNLIRAGYKRKDDDTDSDIVDRWFTDICRSIVLEHHQQLMADPVNRPPGDPREMRVIRSKDLGDGRSEVS